MKRSVCRSRSLKMAFLTADGIFASGDIARNFAIAVRAEFRIRATEEAAGYLGIMFEIDSFESRVEFRFRTGFLVGGGRKSWRVRMRRPALLDSVLKIRRSPRIVGPRAGHVLFFSRAGLAALCGMWTGDMHRFSSCCGHEQGVNLYRERVQTISAMWAQMREPCNHKQESRQHRQDVHREMKTGNENGKPTNIIAHILSKPGRQSRHEKTPEPKPARGSRHRTAKI